MVYPLSNTRDSLTIDFHYLLRQVGAYLGLGYSSAEYDDEQYQTCVDIIRDGYQEYLFPPPISEPYAIGAKVVIEWSFLRPIWSLTTVSSQRRYALPSNFDRPVGDMSHPETGTSFYTPVQFVPASRLRALEYQDQSTSYPQFFSVEPAESQGDSPQEQVLVLHPTPNSAYDLRLQYQAHAGLIDEDHPYPLGGQAHGQGILASCLAIAEFRKDGRHGPHQDRFLSLLAGNVVRDREREGGLLGYNANGSMDFPIGRASLRGMNGIYRDRVSYEGTDYTGA